MDNITGTINSKQIISGRVEIKQEISASISTPIPKPYYKGPYEVTPTKEEQVLETKSKSMKDDVTVKGVPKYEVSNEFGTTFVIG